MEDPFDKRPTKRKAKAEEQPLVLTVKMREGKNYINDRDAGVGNSYYEWEVELESESETKSLGQAIWDQGWYGKTPDGTVFTVTGGKKRIQIATKLVRDQFPNYHYVGATRTQSRSNPNPGTYDYHFHKQ